jgi:hypothetical protein
VTVISAQVVEDPTEGNTGCRIPLVVPFTFVVRHPGFYVVNVVDENGPLTSLELDVRPFTTAEL